MSTGVLGTFVFDSVAAAPDVMVSLCLSHSSLTAMESGSLIATVSITNDSVPCNGYGVTCNGHFVRRTVRWLLWLMGALEMVVRCRLTLLLRALGEFLPFSGRLYGLLLWLMLMGILLMIRVFGSNYGLTFALIGLLVHRAVPMPMMMAVLFHLIVLMVHRRILRLVLLPPLWPRLWRLKL